MHLVAVTIFIELRLHSEVFKISFKCLIQQLPMSYKGEKSRSPM